MRERKESLKSVRGRISKIATSEPSVNNPHVHPRASQRVPSMFIADKEVPHEHESCGMRLIASLGGVLSLVLAVKGVVARQGVVTMQEAAAD